VRAECLQWALEQGELFGIWGGVGEKARRRARARGWSAAELLARADARAARAG
jgi:hypothetical protein